MCLHYCTDILVTFVKVVNHILLLQVRFGTGDFDKLVDVIIDPQVPVLEIHERLKKLLLLLKTDLAHLLERVNRILKETAVVILFNGWQVLLRRFLRGHRLKQTLIDLRHMNCFVGVAYLSIWVTLPYRLVATAIFLSLFCILELDEVEIVWLLALIEFFKVNIRLCFRNPDYLNGLLVILWVVFVILANSCSGCVEDIDTALSFQWFHF